MLDEYELEEARHWLSQIEWRDEIDPWELTEAETTKAIDRHYEGGIHTFRDTVAEGR